MRPPLALDIGWSDLAAAAWACVFARGATARAGRVEALWSEAGDAVAGLSVRSLLDLWIRARSPAAGREVIVSAFTIPDMVTVLQEHGLVAVVVDCDPATMLPRVEDLEAARTPRTRAVLVAHLFGSRSPLDDIAAWARRHRIAVLEDAAQAYAADAWRGDPAADVSFFSFGTIKTATALGGGIARVRDTKVRASMRAIRDADPRQPRRRHAARVLRGAVLRLMQAPAAYGVFVAVCRALRRPHDAILRRAVRGFPRGDLVAAIRHRPSAPLLALLERRLRRPPAEGVGRRTEVGEMLRLRLPGGCMPGSEAQVRTHWVLPVLVADPIVSAQRLRAAGLDAARTASATTVGPAPRCRAMERALVYVPAGAALRDDDVDRIVSAIS